MKSVHFGAGNIGRGFIGLLLHQSGYEIDFVDVNENLIDEMNNERSYRVILANEQKEAFLVKGIKGINSKKAPQDVVEAIAEADIVTTAIGPSILKFIAPLIAEGLKKRKEINGKPVNIIACENMIGGSSELQKFVIEQLNDDEKSWVLENVGFPNSAVDRIVPNQKNEQLLDVLVEPFFEWVIDQTQIKDEQPVIEGALFVKDLSAYIERKLFTVNTGHAATAYLGNVKGFHTIVETIENPQIKQSVLGALEETGSVLIAKYGFDKEQHLQYIQKILGRFSNPFIIDEVSRVGRSPMRKLGKKDRLVAPALEYMNLFGKVPEKLVEVMAAALAFYSVDDQESIELKNSIVKKGVRIAFSDVSNLELDHELVKKVTEVFETFKS